MTYENDNVLLRYEIRSSWSDDPRRQLLILKQGNAVFYRTEKTRKDPDGPDLFLSPSPGAIEKVRGILEEEQLYHLGSIEKPAENWGGTYIYDFFFAGDGHMIAYQGVDLEYIKGKKGYPKVNFLFDILGEVLVPEGVPAECFAAVRRSLAAPIRPAGSRIVKTFLVYDFQKVKNWRMLGQPERQERLERYAFQKKEDGTFSLEVQAGWPGGTGHWDGAGNSFSLPSEWFSGSFEQFLDQLTERYPAKEYGFGREELAGFPGLRDFFGF